MSIETTLQRVDPVTAALVGTSIAAVIGLGVVGLDSVTPRCEIRGKMYTDNECKQVKREVIAKIRNRHNVLPTFEEGEIWKELMGKCKNLRLENVTDENLIDKLNDKLGAGC